MESFCKIVKKYSEKKWAIHCSTFSAMKTTDKIAYSPTVKCYNLQSREVGDVCYTFLGFRTIHQYEIYDPSKKIIILEYFLKRMPKKFHKLFYNNLLTWQLLILFFKKWGRFQRCAGKWTCSPRYSCMRQVSNFHVPFFAEYILLYRNVFWF